MRRCTLLKDFPADLTQREAKLERIVPLNPTQTMVDLTASRKMAKMVDKARARITVIQTTVPSPRVLVVAKILVGVPGLAANLKPERVLLKKALKVVAVKAKEAITMISPEKGKITNPVLAKAARVKVGKVASIKV